ncbi:ATP-dependent nuclease subunit B-like protein [gut metagenome]|uniref:ATP-dependent nuclease subunit B-like protein n=1 Tax=gut metagenome TaxID=749906 RepID=J9CGS2_9ZZZZ
MWRSEKLRMLRNLQKWLDFELHDQEQMAVLLPAATEWEFDFAMQELEYKGSKVYLYGKIDRIDASADKALVTDYKLSENSAKSITDLMKGLDMQMPIYTLAVEARFEGGKELLGETYYSITDGKRVKTALFASSGNPMLQNSKSFKQTWDEFRQQSLTYLKKYITKIYSGDFNVLERCKCNDYCPLKSICRYEEIAQLGKEGNE